MGINSVIQRFIVDFIVYFHHDHRHHGNRYQELSDNDVKVTLPTDDNLHCASCFAIGCGGLYADML